MNLVKSRRNESVALRHFKLGALGLSQEEGPNAVAVVTTVKRVTSTQNPLLEPGWGMIWSFVMGSPWKKDMAEFLVHDEGGNVIVPHEFAPGVIPLSCLVGDEQYWIVEEDDHTTVVKPPMTVLHSVGVWVPDNIVEQNLREYESDRQREAHRLEFARRACDCLSAWLNGDVWEYSIKAYQHVDGMGAQGYLAQVPMVEEECDCVYGFDLEQEVVNVSEQLAQEVGRMLAGRYTAAGLVVSREPAEQVRHKFRVVSN
jgi:hypothetical protein